MVGDWGDRPPPLVLKKSCFLVRGILTFGSLNPFIHAYEIPPPLPSFFGAGSTPVPKHQFPNAIIDHRFLIKNTYKWTCSCLTKRQRENALGQCAFLQCCIGGYTVYTHYPILIHTSQPNTFKKSLTISQ